MVVLVHFIRALLTVDVLVGVVLIVGVDIPALDELRDVLRLGEVVFTLEVPVLDEIGLHRTVRLTPLGLQRQVGNTEGVYWQAVAIDEDTAVGSNGIAVGVELAVGVIERAAV